MISANFTIYERISPEPFEISSWNFGYKNKIDLSICIHNFSSLSQKLVWFMHVGKCVALIPPHRVVDNSTSCECYVGHIKFFLDKTLDNVATVSDWVSVQSCRSCFNPFWEKSKKICQHSLFGEKNSSHSLEWNRNWGMFTQPRFDRFPEHKCVKKVLATI